MRRGSSARHRVEIYLNDDQFDVMYASLVPLQEAVALTMTALE